MQRAAAIPAVFLASILSHGSAQADSWIDRAVVNLRDSSTHIQLQGARATETDFGPAMVFGYDRSPERTTAAALSIGRELSKVVFGWPIQLLGYVGLQQFNERGLQADAYALNVFTKFQKAVNLPFTQFPIRFGLGTGFSYASRIPVVEQRDFAPAKSNRFMVYLEYTVQVSLAHLGGRSAFAGAVSDVYFGYTVLHRSSAYGTFAETGGGVNYVGLGIEVVLR